MLPTNDTETKKLFSELIKKQMLILGPDITLAKVKNVPGVTVDANGEVTSIQGDSQQLLQAIINQFVELSGMIVKKTMESILTSYPGMMGLATAPLVASAAVQPFGQTPQVVPPVSISAAPLPKANMPQQTIQTAAPSAADQAPQPASVATGAPLVEPPPFSNDQMADLNKALDELAKAPLSTEATSAQPQATQ